MKYTRCTRLSICHCQVCVDVCSPEKFRVLFEQESPVKLRLEKQLMETFEGESEAYLAVLR